MAPVRTLLLLLAILLICPMAVAEADALLFESDTVLQLNLPVSFEDLCRPREDAECEFTHTVLLWWDESGDSHSMPVEVKTRGGWRSLSRNCSVPLLWIQFDPNATAGTPFADQTLLPLTTHCGKGISVASLTRSSNRKDFEQYLLREFVAHRIYNQLTEFSLRSRLVRISYPDPDRPRGSARYYAFFVEHFDALAARTGTERPPRGAFDEQMLDAQAAARLALFQYMIGNTDWSVARERNTMLLREPDGTLIPVPYDLDMSGLVNADYAGPAPGLPIDSVTDRCYLGFCQPGIEWAGLFDSFHARQDAILALPGRISGLDRGSQRWITRFLGSFFDLLADPEQRDRRIVEACQPWPPSAEDHTTPPQTATR